MKRRDSVRAKIACIQANAKASTGSNGAVFHKTAFDSIGLVLRPGTGSTNQMKPRRNIAIPPALLTEIEAEAEEENRPPEEVLRQAIERYLENRRWQQLVSYGRQRAGELGLTEADVARLVPESRRERAQEFGSARLSCNHR
jgi:predicted transcriptional regulator